MRAGVLPSKPAEVLTTDHSHIRLGIGVCGRAHAPHAAPLFWRKWFIRECSFGFRSLFRLYDLVAIYFPSVTGPYTHFP